MATERLKDRKENLSKETDCMSGTRSVGSYEKLNESYKKSRMRNYGTPDQYQYRQNQLCRDLAEFILEPYWKKKIYDPEASCN